MTPNNEKQHELKRKLDRCFERIGNLTKETEEQNSQVFNSTRTEAVEELKGKLEGWNERYKSGMSNNDTYSSDLEGIKNLVEDQKAKLLDMSLIRDIIEQKDSNLQNLDYEVAIVNALIDEIKMAELKWAEFEDKEALLKRLIDSLLPKIQELEDVINTQADIIEQVNADLVPMRQTVEKTSDNSDYKYEEDHWDQILKRIDNEHENQSLLIKWLDYQRQFLDELVEKKDGLIDSGIDIPELDTMKTKIEDTIDQVNQNIVTNNEILQRTKDLRVDMKDVSTAKNFEAKNIKSSQIVAALQDIQGKTEAIRERIDNKLQDEKLTEDQAEIVK